MGLLIKWLPAVKSSSASHGEFTFHSSFEIGPFRLGNVVWGILYTGLREVIFDRKGASFLHDWIYSALIDATSFLMSFEHSGERIFRIFAPGFATLEVQARGMLGGGSGSSSNNT